MRDFFKFPPEVAGNGAILGYCASSGVQFFSNDFRILEP